MTSNVNETSKYEYQKERIGHWDSIARKMDTWSSWGSYYHRRLIEIYQFLVAPGQQILEVGCGRGDLLAALKPAVGVGVEFSPEMVCRAKRRHPHLRIVHADAHAIDLKETFDVILLSDLLNDVWDVQTVFERLRPLITPRTRIIMNVYSRLWELPLKLARQLGLATPTLYQNWLSAQDVANILHIADFEIIRHGEEILCPLPLPLLSTFCNRFLVKIWPFQMLALTNVIVARPKMKHPRSAKEPLVSVVIPARNEAGNIEQIISRTPKMGRGTELVFVEGHSSDATYTTIQYHMAAHPERQCQLLQQTGDGKGDAVRLGFAHASGEILMILDADLTVPPEDLPRFYEALYTEKGEFINGVRLVYPMEDQAMQFFNLLGNKFFSLVFSWLLGQPIKDTLCGTKVLWKTDYDRIVANRAYFGNFDPFGDFDLIFGAAKLGLKTIDLPIRYRNRTYGATNIKRWKHGWLLLRMVLFAARRIKFI